jgi:CheY-like chemotaxis protein
VSRKVLIVEDDREIRESLAELLEDEGYNARTAPSGGEGLELLRKEPEPPGVILLDLMMPGVDGFQFRQVQAGDPAIAKIPVVIMSASTDLQSNAKRLGAQAYLKKPFDDLAVVLDTIARFF